jgi:Na+/melibiose symporter-like transporter
MHAGDEGLYSAVFSFINKLEISVVVLVSGYLLVWSGFDTKAAAKGILPTQEVLHSLLWWGFTPLIFFAAVAFVITFFNPLTPAMMAKVHAELEVRRARLHLVESDKAPGQAADHLPPHRVAGLAGPVRDPWPAAAR